ncbi:MAG: HAD-IIB family hydrolase [Acidobacteriota bacterium]
MPIRLVAIDIDGTLLDSQWQLPPRNREAIAAALGHGIQIAIVTGRRYDFAKPILDLLPAPVTAIVSNGAIVRLPDGSTPVRHLLPAQIAEIVLKATVEFRRGSGLIFDRPREGQVVFECIDHAHPSRRGYAERNREFIIEVDPLEDALTEDPIQVMFNGGVAEMRGLAARLRAMPEACGFTVAITEYEARDFSLVDVMPAGCTKGSTLLDWARGQGYRRDEVAAFGDNLNDLEMLQAVGLPIVMGNAVPELLATGWLVTDTHDNAGVAEGIERHVLGVRRVS